MTTSLVLLAGILLAAGLVCLVAAAVPAVPRLDAALERVGLDGPARSAAPDLGPVTKPSERLGALLYRIIPIPLSERQRRALRLQDKPIAEFYADKAVMMIIGARAAGAGRLRLGALDRLASAPGRRCCSLVGAVIGFFVPDLLLRRAADAARSGAVEALLVYIDLVTLERLANASATQALHSAAQLSDGPLFLQIRTALERARLEQQPPYDELRRVADQLHLPELADVADVMQLDETGAALSGALRARVRELRDAHLTSEQIKASAAAEGMTIYMTLPALIFSLIFLVAAMLKIFFPEGRLMTPLSRMLRGLGALALLLLGLVGVPAALVWLGGNPLPAASPGTAVREALLTPDDGTILVGLVTVVGWVAWLVFAVSVVSELVALLSRQRIRLSLPGLAGPQRVAAGLLALGGRHGRRPAAGPAAAGARPTPVAAAAPTPSADRRPPSQASAAGDRRRARPAARADGHVHGPAGRRPVEPGRAVLRPGPGVAPDRRRQPEAC